MRLLLATIATAFCVAACGGGDAAPSFPVGPSSSLQVVSTAYVDGATIPSEYTCEGANASPPLAWEGVPPNARAFALLLNDPDAPGGSYTHWLAYDIPGDVTAIPAGGPVPTGTKLGKNDRGQAAYTGPCPPAGKNHRYVLQLVALDAATGLPAGASREEVVKAIEGHVLASASYTGLFRR